MFTASGGTEGTDMCTVTLEDRRRYTSTWETASVHRGGRYPHHKGVEAAWRHASQAQQLVRAAADKWDSWALPKPTTTELSTRSEVGL